MTHRRSNDSGLHYSSGCEDTLWRNAGRLTGAEVRPFLQWNVHEQATGGMGTGCIQRAEYGKYGGRMHSEVRIRKTEDRAKRPALNRGSSIPAKKVTPSDTEVAPTPLRWRLVVNMPIFTDIAAGLSLPSEA